MQEVFIRAWKYRSSLPEGPIPLAWFYRTAERCCFDRMKKRNREPVGGQDDIAVTFEIPAGQANHEDADLVRRYFYRLEPKLQQVALLHYLDGLPQERIAEQLGWSRRTVGKKIKILRERAARLARRETDR